MYFEPFFFDKLSYQNKSINAPAGASKYSGLCLHNIGMELMLVSIGHILLGGSSLMSPEILVIYVMCKDISEWTPLACTINIH